MRNHCLLLGLLLLPATLRAGDLRPVIRREAAKCAAAWQHSDYPMILAYLPPQLIQQAGGRAAMLREVQGQIAQVREFGVERLEAVPGQPAAPKRIGPWLTALVPLTVVAHRPPLALTQDTHLLALSADQGRHWYFLLLYRLTQQDLDARFPEFAGRLVVPEDPAPSLSASR